MPGVAGLLSSNPYTTDWQRWLASQGLSPPQPQAKPNLVQLGPDAGQTPGSFNPVEALKPSGYGPDAKRRLGIQGAWRTGGK